MNRTLTVSLMKIEPIAPAAKSSTTHITSVSQPLLQQRMTQASSPRPTPAPPPSIQLCAIPSSDSFNEDRRLPIPDRSETTAAERQSSWRETFDAELDSVRYSATSEEIKKLEEVPIETSWRLFLGEVGSVCSSSGSVTSETLAWSQRRARAHRYRYLEDVGKLKPEQVTKRDLTRRARARRCAYLTLVGGLSTAELERRDFERRERARAYWYLEFVSQLSPDELVMRETDRRDRALGRTYLKLIGELE
ncbi:hypothetical protein FS837_010421 [Tulasnella sp. UAMH 9824]|nr:hypothetical protein FS837_010421 [Tulasnella sp. UAMH 9824]